MSPRYLLQTFGGLALSTSDSREPVLVNQRKRLAFIAALAASTNGGVSRERLCALFWPESDDEHARNALSQLMFAIRRDLGDDALLTNAASISLNPAVVDADLRAFRDKLAAARFGDAIVTYRGPFLDGVFLRDTPEFERWSDDLRRSLAVDYARALSRQIEVALSAGPARAAEAIHYARLAAAHDPLSTHAAVLLMRALETGDTAAALRHAAVHAAYVRTELESEPGPELQREVARLRASGTALATATPSEAVQSSEPSAHDVAPEPVRVQRTGEPRGRLLWGTGGVGVAGALALVLFAATSRRDGHSTAGVSEPPDSSRVLVAAFTNRTGDSTLDYVGYITADWITQGLSQSDIVKVIYGPTAYELSRSATGASATDADRMRVLSARSGAGTVIGGSYYLVHDSIVISAQVTDGRTGRVLRTIPSVTAPKSQVMPAVQGVRERSAGALGTVLDPRLASLSSVSSPPPLVAAYREYMEGLELFRRGQPQGLSLQRFLRAAQQDSSFMLPLIWASMMASNTGNVRLRDSAQSVLRAHETQLAPIDRYAFEFLDTIFDSTAVAQQVIAAGSRISALAPASNWSVVQASYLYSAGFAQQALELLQHVDPEHSWAGAWRTYWGILMDTQHRLGDYKAELRTAERAARVGVEAGNPALGRIGAVRALIALGRVDTAMILVRDGDPSLNDVQRLRFVASAARALRAHGRRVQADSLYQTIFDWFRAQRGSPAMRSLQSDYVDYTLQAGALDEAKAVADAVLLDPPSDLAVAEAHAALGLIAAARGDRVGALTHVRQMPNMSSRRVVFRWYASELKALVASALGDREMALQYLAEMESQGQRGDPDAAALTEWYPAFSWLADDPRVRGPYAGRTP